VANPITTATSCPTARQRRLVGTRESIRRRLVKRFLDSRRSENLVESAPSRMPARGNRRLDQCALGCALDLPSTVRRRAGRNRSAVFLRRLVTSEMISGVTERAHRIVHQNNIVYRRCHCVQRAATDCCRCSPPTTSSTSFQDVAGFIRKDGRGIPAQFRFPATQSQISLTASTEANLRRV